MPMLTIERKLVKIQKVTGIEEFKGDKRDYGCSVRIVWIEANTVLDHFDGDSRVAFYMRDDGKTVPDESGQAEMSLPRTDVELTKRKCTQIEMPVRFKKSFEGYTIVFHRGATEASDIKLSEVKLDDFSADMQDGGSVSISCNAYMKPPVEQRGYIDHMSKTEIEVTLTPPAPQQAEPALPKSKGGKKSDDEQRQALSAMFPQPGDKTSPLPAGTKTGAA